MKYHEISRYNTRAGFLPYDTAVRYEMEVVTITRGKTREFLLDAIQGPVVAILFFGG